MKYTSNSQHVREIVKNHANLKFLQGLRQEGYTIADFAEAGEVLRDREIGEIRSRYSKSDFSKGPYIPVKRFRDIELPENFLIIPKNLRQLGFTATKIKKGLEQLSL